MRTTRAATAAFLALLGVALLAGVARAHSELVSSTPADGAVLAAPPTEISGDFSEAVDPGRSTMELRGPEGAQIAVGKVPEGGEPTRIVIGDLPDLAPGVYEVRWTTVTPDDNGLERGTFAFTIAPAAPTAAAPSPTAVPTAAPGTAPADTPSAAPASSAGPTPEPSPATGAGDLLIPLVVLGAVLVAGGAWVLRRR